MTLSFEEAIESADTVDKINSMIIFGSYGTGKTWLGASATRIQDYSPVLIVDVEGSAAGVGRRFPDVDVVKADTHEKFEYIMRELFTTEHKYKTVIVDTLNVAQNRAEAAFRKKPENQNNKFGVYYDLKEWTIGLGREMHHAPFLGIMIAHSNTTKDENTGRMLTQVKVAGGAKEDLPAIPDIVGMMDVGTDDEGNPISILRVGLSQTVTTKNRFGMPDIIFPSNGEQAPNMLDVQQAIIQARIDEQNKE